MKLSVSTGSFWKKGDWIGTNQAIKEISKLKVKNIELCLINLDDILANFNLLKAKKDLKKFRIIGIHMPAFHYKKDRQTRFVVKLMHHLYTALKAKYVVVHANWLKDPYWLKKRKWNILIENSTGYHQIGHKKFINLIKKHRFNMLLDVNHASDYGEKETTNYVKKLKNKIKVIHLAGGHQYKTVWHKSFSKATKKFLKSIEPIKTLNALIVIEDNKKTVKDKELKKEIEKVKEWLNA